MKKYLSFLFLLFFAKEVFSQANQIIIDGASSFTILPDKITLADSSGFPLKSFRLGEKSQIFNRALEYNVSAGFESFYKLDSTQTGGVLESTAIGSRAQREAWSSSYSSAFGASTLKGLTEYNFNSAFGAFAMEEPGNGHSNSVDGFAAFQKTINGSENAAFGAGAMTGGSECGCNSNGNVSFGAFSNFYHNSNNASVYLGYGAGFLHSLFTNLLAIGYNAALKNETLGGIAIGAYASAENNGGGEFISIGSLSSRNATRLSSTTAFGYQSFEGNLGYQASKIALGHNTRTQENSDILIDNDDQSDLKLIIGHEINGRVQINGTDAAILSTTYEFSVFGDASKNNAGNWAGHSDERLKKKIVRLPADETLNNLLSLHAYSYNWKDESKSRIKMTGLIAQEIESVYPEKIRKDADGYYTAAYTEFTPFLVEAISALYQKTNHLKEQLSLLETLEKKIDTELNLLIP